MEKNGLAGAARGPTTETDTLTEHRDLRDDITSAIVREVHM